MKDLLSKVKNDSYQMKDLTLIERQEALKVLATKLSEYSEQLIDANEKDLSEQKGVLSEALYSRLIFDKKKISTLNTGIEDLLQFSDPLNNETLSRELANGLKLKRISTPIGVIAIIFESRPDVAVQIASLLLLSGNAGVLKGGKEAGHTLEAINQVFNQVGKDTGLPRHWMTMVQTREEVSELIQYNEYIDLVIPRGSNQLVKSIMNKSQIPVLGHADGICHIYLAKDFDIDEALPIIYDSKMQSPGTCNALETLLVHDSLFRETVKRIKAVHPVIELNEKPESWSTEWGSPELSIKPVKNLTEAIDHINNFGSHHTDAILTHDRQEQADFLGQVDSGNVFINCSTRFSDGFRYGFGAEIGISTSKIHARGPVGIEGLLSYKYQLVGDGHLVKDFKG